MPRRQSFQQGATVRPRSGDFDGDDFGGGDFAPSRPPPVTINGHPNPEYQSYLTHRAGPQIQAQAAARRQPTMRQLIASGQALGPAAPTTTTPQPRPTAPPPETSAWVEQPQANPFAPSAPLPVGPQPTAHAGAPTISAQGAPPQPHYNPLSSATTGRRVRRNTPTSAPLSEQAGRGVNAVDKTLHAGIPMDEEDFARIEAEFPEETAARDAQRAARDMGGGGEFGEEDGGGGGWWDAARSGMATVTLGLSEALPAAVRGDWADVSAAMNRNSPQAISNRAFTGTVQGGVDLAKGGAWVATHPSETWTAANAAAEFAIEHPGETAAIAGTVGSYLLQDYIAHPEQIAMDVGMSIATGGAGLALTRGSRIAGTTSRIGRRLVRGADILEDVAAPARNLRHLGHVSTTSSATDMASNVRSLPGAGVIDNVSGAPSPSAAANAVNAADTVSDASRAAVLPSVRPSVTDAQRASVLPSGAAVRHAVPDATDAQHAAVLPSTRPVRHGTDAQRAAVLPSSAPNVPETPTSPPLSEVRGVTARSNRFLEARGENTRFDNFLEGGLTRPVSRFREWRTGSPYSRVQRGRMALADWATGGDYDPLGNRMLAGAISGNVRSPGNADFWRMSRMWNKTQAAAGLGRAGSIYGRLRAGAVALARSIDMPDLDLDIDRPELKDDDALREAAAAGAGINVSSKAGGWESRAARGAQRPRRRARPEYGEDASFVTGLDNRQSNFQAGNPMYQAQREGLTSVTPPSGKAMYQRQPQTQPQQLLQSQEPQKREHRLAFA